MQDESHIIYKIRRLRFVFRKRLRADRRRPETMIPLEVDEWLQTGHLSLPPVIPAGARKSTFILTPQWGVGVKVLLRYFLTEKVTKRLHRPAGYGNMGDVGNVAAKMSLTFRTEEGR